MRIRASKKPEYTSWQKPNPSTAYKPFLIGSVIKKICDDKHITPVELAMRLGLRHRNIYRLFKSKHLAMPMLFKMSEALGENLLLRYHPNVPEPADTKEADIQRLQKENEELKQRVNELLPLAEEVKVLKAQLDILREVMKGR